MDCGQSSYEAHPRVCRVLQRRERSVRARGVIDAVLRCALRSADQPASPSRLMGRPALIAMRAAVPCFGSPADAAVAAGATATEMADVPVRLMPITGPPRVIATRTETCAARTDGGGRKACDE
jgi:hypothetical protein